MASTLYRVGRWGFLLPSQRRGRSWRMRTTASGQEGRRRNTVNDHPHKGLPVSSVIEKVPRNLWL